MYEVTVKELQVVMIEKVLYIESESDENQIQNNIEESYNILQNSDKINQKELNIIRLPYMKPTLCNITKIYKK